NATATPTPTTTPTSGAAPTETLEPPNETEREWIERDRLVGEPMTLTGGVGLLHTQHAQGGAPGQFRLAFTAEYFSAGFLCSSTFPCPNPAGGAALTSDSLSHIGG